MSVCFICCRVFAGLNGEKDMWKHVTSYHVDKAPEPKHMCKICGGGFTTRTHLKRHIIYKHYQAGLSPCTHCSRVLKSQRSLRIHLCLVHSVLLNGEKIVEKKYACKICSVRFGIVEAAKRHIFYCKRNKLTQEKVIAKRRRTNSQTKEALLTTIDQASTSKQSDAYGLWKAEDVVDSGQLSVFELLPKPKSTRQKLDKSCMYCSQSMSSMQSLKRHIQRKHPDKIEEANRLGKTYAAIDSTDLPYACLDCGRRVANRAALSLHRRRVHEIKKDHVCSYCYKRYPLASELRRHIKRVHEAPLEESNRLKELQEVVLAFMVKEEHGLGAETDREDGDADKDQSINEDVKQSISEGCCVEALFPVNASEELFVKEELES
ncbi:unnamed protein product, partial [Mesorhabditis belari]|uniref:C2H2-type domain-containing protein n=1 Tax=Mesorhabditis belari TaxID=2138241 RepID=A0AAF3F0W2_9BILA